MVIPPKNQTSKAVEFSIVNEEEFTDKGAAIYGKPDAE